MPTVSRFELNAYEAIHCAQKAIKAGDRARRAISHSRYLRLRSEVCSNEFAATGLRLMALTYLKDAAKHRLILVEYVKLMQRFEYLAQCALDDEKGEYLCSLCKAPFESELEVQEHRACGDCEIM